jgi:hypothetical protein
MADVEDTLLLPDGEGGFTKMIDGDSEINSKGQRMRREGSNAREISSVKQDKFGQDYVSMPELGAADQTKAIQKIIIDGGFSNIEYTGEKDNSGRLIYRRFNDAGQDLDETLIAAGITEINRYTTPEAIAAKDAADARREMYGVATEHQKVGDAIQRKFDSQGIRFKGTSLNEAYYNPDYHSRVAFRDPSRNLDNEAIGFWNQAGESFYQSWQGIKEGLFGYADAIGEVSDSEMFKNLGSQGVARARAKISEQPEIILDYREVDDIFSGFQYVMNNAAMAAPYMAGTIAAMAAAVPVGMVAAPVLGTAGAGALALGVSMVPNSLIFAGQTWNEMQGDKGALQFALATSAGVAMSALERLGLSKLLPSSALLSKTGVAKAADALVNKRKMLIEAGNDLPELTFKQAERAVKRTVRSEQATAILGMGKLDPDDIKNFSLASIAKGTARGAAIESATEVGQESIQMLTAAGASDKRYTSDEIVNRLLNAGIAGGTLGGTISGLGSGRSELKNYLLRKEKVEGSADITKQNVISEFRTQEMANNPESVPTLEEAQKKLDKELAEVEAREPSESELVESPLVSENDLDIKYLNENKDNSALRSEAINIVNEEGGITERVRAAAKDIKDTEGDAAETAFMQSAEAKAERIKNKQSRTVRKVVPKENTAKVFHDRYKETVKGIKNYFTANNELKEYVGTFVQGALNLFRGNQADMEPEKLIKSKTALLIEGLIGGLVMGKFYTGKNHRGYKDNIEGNLRNLIEEIEIIRAVLNDPNASLNMVNSQQASAILKGFGASGAFDAFKKYFNELQTYNSLIRQNQEAELTGAPLVKVSKKPVWDAEKVWKYEVIDFKSKPPKAVKIEKKYTLEEANRLFIAASKVEMAYDAVYDVINEAHLEETGENINKLEGYWWKHDGFDWKKVKAKPAEFKQWAIKSKIVADITEADQLWNNIAHKGEASFGSDFSLVQGTTWKPWAFSQRTENMTEKSGFLEFAGGDIFATLHHSQKEAAKYASSTKYFGHGGRKLNYLFKKLASETNADGEPLYTQRELDQFAYGVVSRIDSEHGNFNRVTNPMLAALNSFLTGWSVFAGLTLAAPSSLPEFSMVYFKVHDDPLFKRATQTLNEQLMGAWGNALAKEVEIAKDLVAKVGLTAEQSSAIDRLAAGERDIKFLRAHEAFFSMIGLTSLTQFQRRINAAFAIDFVSSNIDKLVYAPTKDYSLQLATDPTQEGEVAMVGDEERAREIAKEKEPTFAFDFEKFSKEEMRIYTNLVDLGINVEAMTEAAGMVDQLYRQSLFKISGERSDDDYRDLGEATFRERALAQAAPTDKNGKDLKEQLNNLDAFIQDQMETAIYHFVNERIQNPQSSNRPLFFQDPHYQLFTQFNGFISTFTAVVIPQLYRNGLYKGSAQVKYDTFALIVMLMALGGSSQYIKDMIKFGKPSPYLDSAGYVQRAMYASGVLGQYERVVDLVKPLYPERGRWSLLTAMGGELGPSVRNVNTAKEAAAALLGGDTENAAKKALSVTPVFGSINRGRAAAVDVLHGRSPADSLNYDESVVKSLIDMIQN